MKCQECHKNFSSTVSLVAHIVANHNKKDYYDKWVKSRDEGYCLNCGGPTAFSGRWNRGYNKFCSSKCKYSYINNDQDKINKGKESTRAFYQKKFGVDYYTQSNEFKQKSKKTKIAKYGDPNWNNPELASKTSIKKYGVSNPAKAQFVKDKIINTNIKRYGGPSHMHNKKIFNKVERNAKKSKLHSSGLYYRGSYELDFLNNFSNQFEILNPPGIWYRFEGKDRIYYPDFYIPLLNLIIEIKSRYLAERDFNNIEAKKEACLTAGFEFILIVDQDYEVFIEKYLST